MTRSFKSRSRPGFSLIELVVVLALLGLCGGVIGATLLRQQKFYRGASELLRAREGVRDAMDVLAADVRALSLADSVRLATDSALEFFTTIGSSVVCRGSTSSDVILPALLSRGNTLMSFVTVPDTGDLVVIYRDSLPAAPTWDRGRISSLAPRPGTDTCLGSGDPADRAGYLLRIASARSAPNAGMPVRFVRRARYSLYRSSDGEWYLGYRRCNALGPSVCGAVQPLSGPYRPYSPTSLATGLLFEYFDAGGVKLPVGASSMSRVDVTARAQSRQRIAIDAGGARAFGDSGTVSIALRNE